MAVCEHCNESTTQTEGTAAERWADRRLQYSEVNSVSLKHVSLWNAIIVYSETPKAHFLRELTTMIYLHVSNSPLL